MPNLTRIEMPGYEFDYKSDATIVGGGLFVLC